jgi:hypothetical protein
MEFARQDPLTKIKVAVICKSWGSAAAAIPLMEVAFWIALAEVPLYHQPHFHLEIARITAFAII